MTQENEVDQPLTETPRYRQWTDDEVESITRDVLTGASLQRVADKHGVTRRQVERLFNRWLRETNYAEAKSPTLIAQHLAQRLWQIANNARSMYLKEVVDDGKETVVMIRGVPRTSVYHADKDVMANALKLESDTMAKLARLKGLDKLTVGVEMNFSMSSVEERVAQLQKRQQQLKESLVIPAIAQEITNPEGENPDENSEASVHDNEPGES